MTFHSEKCVSDIYKNRVQFQDWLEQDKSPDIRRYTLALTNSDTYYSQSFPRTTIMDSSLIQCSYYIITTENR